MSCIYKFTFPDGSVYIGRTDGIPEDRWRGGWGYDPSSMVFKTIFYFGWKNVKKEILEDGLTHEEAKNSEKTQIMEHSALCTVINNYDNPAQMYDTNNELWSESAQKFSNDLLSKRPNKSDNRIGNKRTFVIPIVPKPEGSYRCPVDAFDLHGNFLETFPNAKVASEKLHVNHGSVVSCCLGVNANGVRRYQAGGYIFRYHNPKFWDEYKNEDTE